MSTTLPEFTQHYLDAHGFKYALTDARTHREHWLNQEALPHIQLILDPAEETTAADIVRAIFHAGARHQREMTRDAYNRLITTFRHAQPIEPAEDLLHLTEPPPVIPA